VAKPYEPWPGCETLEWRPADGSAAIRFNVQVGTTGRFMPPVAVTTVPVPGGNGSRFTGAYHLERAVAVPIVLPGIRTDRAVLRTWMAALDPGKGLGRLATVGAPLPFARELECIYDSGLEEWAEDFPQLGLATLIFRAPDPYWKTLAQSVSTAGGGAVRHWFPFLPLILGSTNVAAAFTVNNTGDVRTWPVVTVTGPATSPVRVADDTTGEYWEYTGALAAGQVLTVDHRPGYQAATVDGANVFAALSPGSVLFSLPKGFNQIAMTAGGTTSATQLTFTWRARYLTP
jgi:phage-related protein